MGSDSFNSAGPAATETEGSKEAAQSAIPELRKSRLEFVISGDS
jgi:hypothetical protein